MHCHLDLYPEPHKISSECKRRGTYVLSVTTTPRAWNETQNLARGTQRIRTALGLHPQLAHQRAHEIELFDSLLPHVDYVGEIGLDGGSTFKMHHSAQLKVFRHILKSVDRMGGKIMTIHSQASVTDVLQELKGTSGVPILHWFTGTPEQADQAIDMGCWFSMGPAMLTTQRGKGLALRIPKNRILTETDGPFAKHRGRTLLPWDSKIAISQLADIWKMSTSDTEIFLKNNLRSLLSLKTNELT